jgi:hypothetical protein
VGSYKIHALNSVHGRRSRAPATMDWPDEEAGMNACWPGVRGGRGTTPATYSVCWQAAAAT